MDRKNGVQKISIAYENDPTCLRSRLSLTARSASWAELSEQWEDDEDDIPENYFEQHLLRASVEQKLREAPGEA